MIRVRACTMRWRCHSSCRRSRFSQLGTQICGNRSSSSNCKISRASWRSVFCLRIRWCGSRLHRRSTTQSATRPAAVQTSAHARWPPFRHAPAGPQPSPRGKTSPPRRDAPAAFPETLPCPYRPKRFAETRGENLLLVMIIVRLLSPEPVGWIQHHQLYLGRGSRHCHGINYAH
jgi:hypothetical protein